MLVRRRDGDKRHVQRDCTAAEQLRYLQGHAISTSRLSIRALYAYIAQKGRNILGNTFLDCLSGILTDEEAPIKERLAVLMIVCIALSMNVIEFNIYWR